MDNQLLRKKIRLVWTVILLAILIAFLLTGCKPKQIIQERIIYKTDSSAITKLRDSIYRYEVKIGILEIDLERSKEENINLLNEVSRYETYYDTSKPLNPETGKPPIASEITTISSSQLEKNLKEQVKLNAEYRIENEMLARINRNQEFIIESLKQENRELKQKTTPTTGFNIKLFLAGVGTGILLIILLLIFIRR